MTKEAEVAMVSRRELLRRAMAQRYGLRQTAVRPLADNQEQEAREQGA